MENICIAFTNIASLPVIMKSMHEKDEITKNILIFVSLSSFVSHLIEKHKHGMTSFSFITNDMSYFMNRMDVLGCFMTIIRFILLFYKKYGLNVNKAIDYPYYLLPICFCFNILSEFDKTQSTKKIYIICHSIWHLSVFYILDRIYVDLVL